MRKVKTVFLAAALFLCVLGVAQALYPVYCDGAPEYRCEVTPIDDDGNSTGPTEVTYGDTLVIEF